MAEFKITKVDDKRGVSPDQSGLSAWSRGSLAPVRVAAQRDDISASLPHSGEHRQSRLSSGKSMFHQCKSIRGQRKIITNHRQGADAP